MKNLKLILLASFFCFSCVEEKKIIKKKGLNIFYIILDKTSTSYSINGGYEENYINVDSLYIENFIQKLNTFINKENKNDIVLFFNYVDKDVKGNRELFLKLSSYKPIETNYKPKGGEVISNRKNFEEDVLRLKGEKDTQIKDFESKKKSSIKTLNKMMLKSKNAKGSDCSSLLLLADKKLNSYMVDTTKYNIKKKIIIAFSDLVNIPKTHNKTELTITNKIVRPGYTSEVKYLNKSDIINITTEDEFEEYLNTIIN